MPLNGFKSLNFPGEVDGLKWSLSVQQSWKELSLCPILKYLNLFKQLQVSSKPEWKEKKIRMYVSQVISVTVN